MQPNQSIFVHISFRVQHLHKNCERVFDIYLSIHKWTIENRKVTFVGKLIIMHCTVERSIQMKVLNNIFGFFLRPSHNPWTNNELIVGYGFNRVLGKYMCRVENFFLKLKIGDIILFKIKYYHAVVEKIYLVFCLN